MPFWDAASAADFRFFSTRGSLRFIRLNYQLLHSFDLPRSTMLRLVYEPYVVGDGAVAYELLKAPQCSTLPYPALIP